MAALQGEWGGSSPLALAAGRGHLQVARHLISYGADVNAKDDTVSCVLCLCLVHGLCCAHRTDRVLCAGTLTMLLIALPVERQF